MSGCTSFLHEGTSATAGIGGAALAGAVTNNAAVATGIGVGVQAAAQAGLDYAERQAQTAEQDEIARVAGPLKVGDVAKWAFAYKVPIKASESGEVTVSRLIGAPGLECKEIVFSVIDAKTDDPQKGFYLAAICRDGKRWKWASAEPATERWGALQ